MHGAWRARVLAGLAIVTGAVALAAAPASAHPLGNFTTNRYARIEIGAQAVRVHYVLDEAELVAFRERDAITVQGQEAFAESRVDEIRRGLALRVGADVLQLRTVDARLSQPAGQGGLSTLRIDALFEATLVGRSKETLHFEDRNQPDRLGWREIVASAASGSRLAGDAPVRDRSDGLRHYPTDPAVAPLDVRSATFTFTPGTGADAAASLDESAAPRATIAGDRFVRLLDETTSSPLAIAGALLVAALFGMVHAFGPGHGKTVMAAYLVSTEGRKRDALALGTIVSLMHTVSVLALAAVLATVGQNLDAARLYPALTLAAGVLVVGVGARLLQRRLRMRRRVSSPAIPEVWATTTQAAVHRHGGVAVLDRPEPTHDAESHHHAPQDHHHDGHEHGPGTHTHDLPPDVSPLSRSGLIALGTSGGLFPSPSAVVVLLGAFALGRALLGLALIVAFSVGLAAVLVTIGLLLVAGRRRISSSRFAVHLPWLPIVGAGAIVLLGVVLVGQGVTQLR